MLVGLRPVVLVLVAALLMPAQNPPDPQAGTQPPATRTQRPHRTNTVRELPRNLVSDQKAIWTSPLKVRGHDLFWIAPFGAATGALIATDDSNMRHISTSPDRLRISRDIGNFGVGAMAGSTGAAYLIGHFTRNEHARETGLLGAEALANGFIVDNVFKVATRRDRPSQPGSTGRFWSDGLSFPSEHSTAAWSVASVLAREYPGTMTQLLAYGAATAISVSRVTARQHFPSDVLVGSTAGYLIGRYVYRAHHNPEIPGANIGTFERSGDETRQGPATLGSTYVPLDSWTYAAFDRLSALGYVQTAFAGMRPWTRLDCARLVQEAGDLLPADDDAPGDASGIVKALGREFRPELERLAGGSNHTVELESIYTRVTAIGGQPLTDGYHFGQTCTNDFGRPYGSGANVATGMSSRAVYGRWAFYVRGEYQHAPAPQAVSDAARQAIAVADHTPGPPTTVPTDVNRVRLLDTYVALAFHGWQASFGKQSLWWGPGAGGAIMLSDNAEPVTMLRLSQTAPTRLPSIFGWLGPVRTEFFFGRLAGQRFVSPDFRSVVGGGRQPYIHGEKLTFKPTPNLEFGFSRTAILGGPGLPLTWRTVARSYFATTNATGPNDPGDRRAGFDFRYRVPGLRNWLVLYNDALAEDEISPIGYPRKSAMNPGIYLPRIPGAARLDLRVEAASTDLPGLKYKGGWFYWNDKYLSGYTNRGQLLGNWVGRQASGIEASSNYWLSAENKLTLTYRHAAVSREFLQGGALDNVSTRADIAIRADLRLTTGVQYERWSFPLLSASRKTDVGAWLQLTFTPAWAWR